MKTDRYENAAVNYISCVLFVSAVYFSKHFLNSGKNSGRECKSAGRPENKTESEKYTAEAEA